MIVATIIALASGQLTKALPVSNVQVEPVLAFFLSILTNVSQVVLIGNGWSGAIILLALFIANWKVGVAAVAGSVLGTAVAIILGVSWITIATGLAGYSAVLTAIALSVVFLKGSAGSWLYSLPWTAAAVILTRLLDSTSVPVYTWPYILTTWAALIVAHYLGGLRRN